MRRHGSMSWKATQADSSIISICGACVPYRDIYRHWDEDRGTVKERLPGAISEASFWSHGLSWIPLSSLSIAERGLQRSRRHRVWSPEARCRVVKKDQTEIDAWMTWSITLEMSFINSFYTMLGLRPANERRCYFVTTSLVGGGQT